MNLSLASPVPAGWDIRMLRCRQMLGQNSRQDRRCNTLGPIVQKNGQVNMKGHWCDIVICGLIVTMIFNLCMLGGIFFQRHHHLCVRRIVGPPPYRLMTHSCDYCRTTYPISHTWRKKHMYTTQGLAWGQSMATHTIWGWDHTNLLPSTNWIIPTTSGSALDETPQDTSAKTPQTVRPRKLTSGTSKSPFWKGK